MVVTLKEYTYVYVYDLRPLVKWSPGGLSPWPWAGFKFTILVVIGANCRGSCKSNYHIIMITTAPKEDRNWVSCKKIQHKVFIQFDANGSSKIWVWWNTTKNSGPYDGNGRDKRLWYLMVKGIFFKLTSLVNI